MEFRHAGIDGGRDRDFLAEVPVFGDQPPGPYTFQCPRCGDTYLAELAPLRIHDVRHTAATLMLLAGVHPRVAADRPGHSSVGVPLDRYSHVSASMESDAAQKLAGLPAGTG